MQVFKNGTKIYEFNAQELKALITSIQGNISSNYLTKDTIANMVASSRSLYVVDTLPAEPTRNTMYYVGNASPYHIYLYDSNGAQIDLGESELDLSNYYTKTEADNKFMPKQNFLNTFYPKGSTYITYENINPSTFLGGTWALIGGSDANLNYYPAFAIDGDTAGATIAESLPNIKGEAQAYSYSGSNPTGAFSKTVLNPGAIKTASEEPWLKYTFNAHNFDGTYQDNAHVNVNAIKLFYWRRTDDTEVAYQLTPLNILNEMPTSPTNDTVLGTKAIKDYVDAGTKTYRHTFRFYSSSSSNMYGLYFSIISTKATEYSMNELSAYCVAQHINGYNPIVANTYDNEGFKTDKYPAVYCAGGILYYKSGSSATTYSQSTWTIVQQWVEEV